MTDLLKSARSVLKRVFKFLLESDKKFWNYLNNPHGSFVVWLYVLFPQEVPLINASSTGDKQHSNIKLEIFWQN